MSWLLVRLVYIWASHLFVLITLYRHERVMWARMTLVELGVTALLVGRVLVLPEAVALPVELLGMVLVLLPYPLAIWARRALGQVNWEAPRGESLPTTITTRGPYSLVRHPLYLAMFLGGAGHFMILGSWLSFPFLLAFAGLAFANALHDERKIMSSPLAGAYATYAATVRSRFLPFVL